MNSQQFRKLQSKYHGSSVIAPSHRRKIMAAFEGVKNLEVEFSDKYMIILRTSRLKIKVTKNCREKPTSDSTCVYYDINIAYRPTFDRWANSTNFHTSFSFDFARREDMDKYKKANSWHIKDMKKTLRWCNRVARSGLLDFNGYFNVIETPYFHENPKSQS